LCYYAAERLGRGIVTDGITTPVVNTSAYFFKKTADLIDFKVFFFFRIIAILLDE
jgi:cystathionine gamma-synthase